MTSVAYLRISVDPNTDRHYSLSVVILGGVCGILASIMFGVSAVLTFSARRNSKYDTKKKRNSLERKHELDDEEIEDIQLRKTRPVSKAPATQRLVSPTSTTV